MTRNCIGGLLMCIFGFPKRSLVVVLPLVLEVSVKSSL